MEDKPTRFPRPHPWRVIPFYAAYGAILASYLRIKGDVARFINKKAVYPHHMNLRQHAFFGRLNISRFAWVSLK
jgi:hypothetical protein